MTYEIFFDLKINDYVLADKTEDRGLIKKKPLKFKFNDSTAKFRKRILREGILKLKR